MRLWTRHVGHHEVVHRSKLGQTRVNPLRYTDDTGPMISTSLAAACIDRRTVFLGMDGRLGEGPEPFHRVRDLRLQSGEHARTWFLSKALRGFVRRHRHQRDQGGFRQLTAVEQELAYYPADQRHRHVVDRDPEVVLDLLDVIELELGEGDLAIRGETAVEPVRGAVNGAAIARPRAARRMVSTTALMVAGSSLMASYSGRLANRARPPIAIRNRWSAGIASTGSGGGGSGSVLHSCESKLTKVTPSAAAWWTLR